MNKENRITDKILDDNFKSHDTGYWRINDEVIISCEGCVYAEDSEGELIFFMQIHFIDELKNLYLLLEKKSLGVEFLASHITY